MVGLLDIAPLTETVDIHGTTIEVRGLGVDDLAYLIQRFPEVGRALVERTIDAAGIVGLGPGIVGAAIAVAIGAQGDLAQEKAATSRLTLTEQVDVVAVIMRLTTPEGVVPFVERLTGLFGAPAVSGRGQVLN